MLNTAQIADSGAFPLPDQQGMPLQVDVDIGTNARDTIEANGPDVQYQKMVPDIFDQIFDIVWEHTAG